MSSLQTERVLIPTGIIWFCRQVATQPVGVPSPMGYTLTIPEGERGLFLGGLLGPDDYGANRQVDIKLKMISGDQDLFFITSDSVDNNRNQAGATLVSITETATTPDTLGLPYMPYILPELSQLRVNGTSLANTETLTANLLIATRVLPPVAAPFGSGVTLTTNTILQV